jgi:deoxyribose-phosphate aldolase
MKLEKYMDHTILKADATKEAVRKVCLEAVQYGFASVCVNPCYTTFVRELLKNSDVNTCVVIGFPLGANTKEVKAFETKQAVENGAQEVDMVINIGALKDKDYDVVKEDIESVVKAADKRALVKVILETCLLTDEEKVKACEIAKTSGADFVKTSTGFSTGGATAEDVALMRKTVGEGFGVKASGGIRNYAAAAAMIAAGADRLGVSSSVAIVNSGTESEKDGY